MLVATTDAARPLRRHYVLPNGTGYHRSNFIGRDAAVASDGPTCYLVEQEPSSTIQAHFHRANQFQVIVSGRGKLGREPVSALAVHYAGAYTPYGPIVSEADGIHYFTIRDAFDPGARWMPDMRAQLPKVARRHLMSQPLDMTSEDPEVMLLGPDPDGLAAVFMRLRPDERKLGHAPSDGGGQFYLLLAGSLHHNGRKLTPYASIHVGRDEPVTELAAGSEGAAILMLQFGQAS
jgi:hypothetical protein